MDSEKNIIILSEISSYYVIFIFIKLTEIHRYRHKYLFGIYLLLLLSELTLYFFRLIIYL